MTNANTIAKSFRVKISGCGSGYSPVKLVPHWRYYERPNRRRWRAWKTCSLSQVQFWLKLYMHTMAQRTNESKAENMYVSRATMEGWGFEYLRGRGSQAAYL